MLLFAIVVVAVVGTIMLVAGAILALSGAGIIPGIALIVLGLLVTLVAGGLAVAWRMWRIAMEWRELLKGGPGAVRLASVQPPRGAIFNREAVLTFDVEGKDGTTKSLERGITIPIPQAILWKLSGRVPTPIGSLRDRRELNLHLWRRRS